MSDDFNKGYRGEGKDFHTDDAEYRRGAEAREANQAPRGGGAMNTSGMEAAAARTSRQWKVSPNKTLFRLILSLIVFTGVAGLLGYGAAAFTNFTPEPMSWALIWGGVAFFFGGVMTVAQILGALTHRFTALGCLVFLALTAVLIGLAFWATVLGQPPLF